MKILAVFAHPDDETILCGGLLALLAKANHDIHYLCCTRGEGGECGDPPLCNQNELGSLRENELTCAVENLSGKRLTFLDYKDPLVGSDNHLFSFTEDISGLSNEIKNYIRDNEIDIIISHGSNGEYGHPGHLTVYQAIKMLFDEEQKDLFWYSVQAFYENSPKPHILNKDDIANWIVDCSSVLDKKIAAALCHKSQHALFVRKKSKEVGRIVDVKEVIVPFESYYFAKGKEDILVSMPIIQKCLTN